MEKKKPENKKVFIGGLPKGLSEEEFKAYFEKYGELLDYAIICDKKTKEPRGTSKLIKASDLSPISTWTLPREF